MSKRAANFTADEEDLLLKIVAQYAEIIENKKTDNVSSKFKSDCWIKIENEFNCAPNVNTRSASTLRGKYENIKKATKRRYAENKSYNIGIDGGPPKDLTPMIKGELDFSEITEINHQFDDYVGGQPLSNDKDDDSTAEPTASESSEKINTDRASFTPDQLKQPRTTLRTGSTTKFRSLIKDKISQWASEKSINVQRQREWHDEEAQIRKKHMTEEHLLKLKHMQEKHDEEMRFLKYQNKLLELEILQQKKNVL